MGRKQKQEAEARSREPILSSPRPASLRLGEQGWPLGRNTTQGASWRPLIGTVTGINNGFDHHGLLDAGVGRKHNAPSPQEGPRRSLTKAKGLHHDAKDSQPPRELHHEQQLHRV